MRLVVGKSASDAGVGGQGAFIERRRVHAPAAGKLGNFFRIRAMGRFGWKARHWSFAVSETFQAEFALGGHGALRGNVAWFWRASARSPHAKEGLIRLPPAQLIVVTLLPGRRLEGGPAGRASW